MSFPANMPRPTGFALAEALVALLLLAIATIGAGGAMLQALAAQRAALLRTQAADLAADLSEALRAAPDALSAQAEISVWQAQVTGTMPRAAPAALPRSAVAAALPAGFDIVLQWRDGRSPPSLLTLPVSPGTP